MPFRGTFEHSLDVKHRLTIPSAFRKQLSTEVVLVPSPHLRADAPYALSIWTPDKFDEFVEFSLAGLNPMSPDAQDLSRMLSNEAFETELDSANRVMIPSYLLDFASIEKDVAVTGSGNRIEVWNRADHARNLEQMRTRLPETVARIVHTA
ncbi:MAG: division/cell wall cluster transcriptional repressor MraZ [Solirubrobacteraceae bacterium]